VIVRRPKTPKPEIRGRILRYLVTLGRGGHDYAENSWKGKTSKDNCPNSKGAKLTSRRVSRDVGNSMGGRITHLGGSALSGPAVTAFGATGEKKFILKEPEPKIKVIWASDTLNGSVFNEIQGDRHLRQAQTRSTRPHGGEFSARNSWPEERGLSKSIDAFRKKVTDKDAADDDLTPGYRPAAGGNFQARNSRRLGDGGMLQLFASTFHRRRDQ